MMRSCTSRTRPSTAAVRAIPQRVTKEAARHLRTAAAHADQNHRGLNNDGRVSLPGNCQEGILS
jgi:hypothetical protein